MVEYHLKRGVSQIEGIFHRYSACSLDKLQGNLFQCWKLRRITNGNVDYCPFGNTYCSRSAIRYDEEAGLEFKPPAICFFPNR